MFGRTPKIYIFHSGALFALFKWNRILASAVIPFHVAAQLACKCGSNLNGIKFKSACFVMDVREFSIIFKPQKFNSISRLDIAQNHLCEIFSAYHCNTKALLDLWLGLGFSVIAFVCGP